MSIFLAILLSFSIQFMVLDKETTANASEKTEDGIVVKLDPWLMAALEEALQRPEAQAFVSEFPMPDGSLHTLTWHPWSIWAVDAMITVNRSSGMGEMLAPATPHPYQAVINEGEDNEVILLRMDEAGQVNGVVKWKDEWFSYESIGASSLGFQRLPTRGIENLICGVSHADLTGEAEADGKFGSISAGLHAEEGSAWTHFLKVEVAIETDYEFYQGRGSQYAAISFIHDLFFIANYDIYHHLGIHLTLSYLSLHDLPNDPWEAMNPVWSGPNEKPNINNKSLVTNILDEFEAHWNDPNNDFFNIRRDVAYFLSGKVRTNSNDFVGVAEIGEVCSGYAYGVGLVGHNSSSVESGDVLLFAHELGHLFGSPHTHEYGGPTGQVDGNTAIIDDCPNGVSPTDGGPGTIMSYCSDPALEFHPRPANVIRTTLENASCVPVLTSPVIEINNHETKNNIDSPANAFNWGYTRWFVINIPPGASNLKVTTSCTSDEVDLWMGLNATLDHTVFEGWTQVSMHPGGNETLTLPNPAPGPWYIRIEGQAGGRFSGVCLEAHYTETLKNGHAKTDITANSPGANPVGVIIPTYSRAYTIDVPSGSTYLVAETFDAQGGLDGCGITGDADLYVAFERPVTSLLLVAPTPGYDYVSATSGCNAERIVIADPVPGTYHVLVYAAQDFSGVDVRATFDTPLALGDNQTVHFTDWHDRALFRIDNVLAGATALTLSVGGTGSHELLGKAGEPPHPLTFNGSDYSVVTSPGNFYTIPSPTAGRWYVLLRNANQRRATVELSAQLNRGNTVVLSNHVPQPLNGPLNPLYLLHVPQGASRAIFELDTYTGTEALYVYTVEPTVTTDGIPGGWIQSSLDERVPENPLPTVTLHPVMAGEYYVYVDGVSGGETLTGRYYVAPQFVVNPNIHDHLYIPASGLTGEPIPFAVSVSAAQPAHTITWDFGDQTPPVNGAEPDHVYTAPGVYQVTVTVSNGIPAEDLWDARPIQIFQQNRAPVLTSLNGPVSGQAGQSLQFDVVALDPNGDSLTYDWEFGDGTNLLNSNSHQVSHTFTSLGTFKVGVLVRDPFGLFVERAMHVQITN